jgi:hypothetical protein
MAFEEAITFTRVSGKCSASTGLTTSQFHAVTNLAAMVVSTAAANMDGILQDNPDKSQVGAVAVSGISKACISASQTLTANTTLLEVDTGGTLKAHASGTVVAKAMESLTSNTAVCIVAVRILPNNATF